jgi:hypothetical protein
LDTVTVITLFFDMSQTYDLIGTGIAGRSAAKEGLRNGLSSAMIEAHCANCHDPFYQGQDIVVVGGGDAAVQEAIVLSDFARSLHVTHRGRRRACRVWRLANASGGRRGCGSEVRCGLAQDINARRGRSNDGAVML